MRSLAYLAGVIVAAGRVGAGAFVVVVADLVAGAARSWLGRAGPRLCLLFLWGGYYRGANISIVGSS